MADQAEKTQQEAPADEPWCTGEVHVMPPGTPTQMLAIVFNDDFSLLAYVGCRGLPNAANARRLAAAWNVLRGQIETEDLVRISAIDCDVQRAFELADLLNSTPLVWNKE